MVGHWSRKPALRKDGGSIPPPSAKFLWVRLDWKSGGLQNRYLRVRISPPMPSSEASGNRYPTCLLSKGRKSHERSSRSASAMDVRRIRFVAAVCKTVGPLVRPSSSLGTSTRFRRCSRTANAGGLNPPSLGGSNPPTCTKMGD